ncbi:hypothetical protein ACFL6S_32120 [Candidatus Poribacteria bacterium]
MSGRRRRRKDINERMQSLIRFISLLIQALGYSLILLITLFIAIKIVLYLGRIF